MRKCDGACAVLRARHGCSFDVITMPDGILDALYTAGQLCVFRNIGYFRTVFQISTRHKERGTIVHHAFHRTLRRSCISSTSNFAAGHTNCCMGGRGR